MAQTAVKEGLTQTVVAGLLSAIALPMQLNTLAGIIDNSWVRYPLPAARALRRGVRRDLGLSVVVRL